MSKPTYWELLRDPRWQKMRLQVMERERFACETCGDSDRTLNVHHSYYEKGLMPWEYPEQSLHCLCERCHLVAQEMLAELHRVLGMLPLAELPVLIGAAKGLVIEQNKGGVQVSYGKELAGIVRILAAAECSSDGVALLMDLARESHFVSYELASDAAVLCLNSAMWKNECTTI